MSGDADLVAQLVESKEPGSMVTRYVLVAEIIDPEGERWVVTSAQDGSTRWDNYGLLTWALTEEKVGHHIARTRDDD